MELIWDFDGTLFDSYPLMAASLRRALAEEGILESEENVRAHMSVSMGHTLDFYRTNRGMSDAAVERYKEYVKERGFAGFRPFPGAQELCRRVVAEGGHNHLCTHRGKGALEYIAAAGMRELFTVCVTAESGFPRKPAPDGVEHIIRTMKLPKEQFVMLGDRELDVEAGQGAGIRAGRFTNGEADVETKAEIVFADFAQAMDQLFC